MLATDTFDLCTAQEFAKSGRSLAMCVCGWNAEEEKHMSIRPGQVIHVTERGSQWSRGRIVEGSQVDIENIEQEPVHLFPSKFVVMLVSDPEYEMNRLRDASTSMSMSMEGSPKIRHNGYDRVPVQIPDPFGAGTGSRSTSPPPLHAPRSSLSDANSTLNASRYRPAALVPHHIGLGSSTTVTMSSPAPTVFAHTGNSLGFPRNRASSSSLPNDDREVPTSGNLVSENSTLPTRAWEMARAEAAESEQCLSSPAARATAADSAALLP